MTLTDVSKMKDADIIVELSKIIYKEFGFIEEDAEPEQNRAQMLIDELEHRHVTGPILSRAKRSGAV